jgi:RNA polymerase sigma-70 factor (ECF subfamily)
VAESRSTLRAVEASDREALEARVRSLCEAGQHEAATTATLEGYGPELLGFLINILGTEEDAGEAFSLFAENLWRGLPKFQWRASLRTWAYAVARHAAFRLHGARKNAERNVPLSGSPVAEMAEKVRSSTMPFQRTAVKNEIARLREGLPEDDRVLLVLRLDRQLPWEEIAEVMLGEENPTRAALTKESARLRKRFQLLKEKLREQAVASGLLDR